MGVNVLVDATGSSFVARGVISNHAELPLETSCAICVLFFLLPGYSLAIT